MRSSRGPRPLLHGFNTTRLHSAIDYQPPAEVEHHYRDTHATAGLAVA